MSQPSCYTSVPGQPPIELVAYYDEFSSYYPNCEPATKAWFVRHIAEDWVTLDCGANVGYFSLLFARLAPQGHVYAFEPTRTYELLLANLRHHGVANVTALPLALGKCSGPQQESIFRLWGKAPEQQVYPFTTIDEFVTQQRLTRVDCLKIDVDSFDFEVLQGAEQTLAAFNPYVMVELNHALSRRNQSNMAALEWMARRGYTEAEVFDYDNFLFKRQPPRSPARSTGLVLRFAQPDGLNAALPAASLVAPTAEPPRLISTRELIDAGPDIPVVPVGELHTALGLSRPLDYPPASLAKPLSAWRMEDDDAPIFRYLYRELQPRRHLEFGTWQGTGALYCLEESAATVWTLNLPFGEGDGPDAYSFHPEDESAVRAWAQRLGLPAQAHYRTDTLGFIGRRYLERGWGSRVCQIYADSRAWDISAYPAGFFDTVLIDGGHTAGVVANDTHKAFQLVRPGGVVLWHDFCPPVYGTHASTRGVLESLAGCWDWLTAHTRSLFWIYPSWILLGVRNDVPLADFPEAAPAASEVCVRLGQMLQRARPISEAELEQGVAALTALLGAPDIPAYLETAPRPFPPTLLPLLTLNREAALADGNPLLAEVLEQIRDLIQLEGALA